MAGVRKRVGTNANFHIFPERETQMTRKLIPALALASALGFLTTTAYAQSDEGKQEKKPEQSQLSVAQSDEGKQEKKPEQSQLLMAQSDEKEPKEPKKPELIA